MAMIARPHVIVTGDFGHRDFARSFDGSVGHFSFRSITELIGPTTRHDSQPDLIVIAQSRRGQFAQRLVYEISDCFPIAPVVIVFGSWCEGETRSGKPLVGAHRIAWHRWPWLFQIFCRQLVEQGFTIWHEPTTRSRADVLAESRTSSNVCDEYSSELRIVVSSEDREGYLSIADAFGGCPWSFRWLETSKPLPDPPDVCVINSSYGILGLNNQIDDFRQNFGDIALVVVAGFLRDQDVQQLGKDYPLMRLVSKPFDHAELRCAILAASECPPTTAASISQAQ